MDDVPVNSPYLQGVYDAKQGNPYQPKYWFEFEGKRSLVTLLTNSERAEYVEGWDAVQLGKGY